MKKLAYLCAAALFLTSVGSFAVGNTTTKGEGKSKKVMTVKKDSKKTGMNKTSHKKLMMKKQ
jgi:hypothetical protein